MTFSVDSYRRMLISDGFGVELPRMPGTRKLLADICRRGSPVVSCMVENGLFNEGSRLLLILPPDEGLVREFFAHLKLKYSDSELSQAADRIREMVELLLAGDDLPRPKPVSRLEKPVWTRKMAGTAGTVPVLAMRGKEPLGPWMRESGLDPDDVWDSRFFGQPCIKVRRMRPSVVPKSGSVTGRDDLEAIFDAINHAAFLGNLPRYKVRWGRSAGHGKAWAHASHLRHEIVFSKSLWGPFLPVGFLWFVMYHEMLHVACPPTNPFTDKGHHSEFNEKEALFPDHDKWMETDHRMSKEISMFRNKIVPISEAPHSVQDLAGRSFLLNGVRVKITHWWQRRRTVIAVDHRGFMTSIQPDSARGYIGRGSNLAANPRRYPQDDVQHLVFRSFLTGEPIPPD